MNDRDWANERFRNPWIVPSEKHRVFVRCVFGFVYDVRSAQSFASSPPGYYFLAGSYRSEQGARDINGGSFGTRSQRGGYWGSEAFREKLMTRVDSKALGANPNYRSSAMGQDRREKDGERVIVATQRHDGVALNE